MTEPQLDATRHEPGRQASLTTSDIARSLGGVMAQTKSVFEVPLDGVTIAQGVAEQLRGQLGDRLRRVLLYGSWARGQGRADSDVDILVVMSAVASGDDHLDRVLSETAGDWFERGGRMVSIGAISEGDIGEAATARYPSPRQMFIRNAMSEAETIFDAA